jgi:hypothetical protein
VVGHSDNPVHSRDLALGNIWSYGNLMGNVSISSQITDQESSKFTISRPFTNNSGEQVALREIGIMSYSQNQWMLLARDVLASAVQLAQGSTLSIDYEVVSNIQNFTQDTDTGGTNGGWTIEVKEIGLFGNGSTSTTMTPSLFARKALDANDQFTIQPGQTVKVGFLCKAFI